MPAQADRIREKREWQPNWLAFSHGRAALAWLIARTKPVRAAVCAYTCPSIPDFLRTAGLDFDLFDAGAQVSTLEDIARKRPGRALVLIPSLFGSMPWLDAQSLAARLGRRGVVVIDAAQTAFGHRDFAVPQGGATLSCPRKTTALADGAVLALGEGLKAGIGLDRLPVAEQALACKEAARALWATRDPALEADAVDLNRRSERGWPDAPHRMSDTSRVLLERIDPDWHRKIRRRNRARLAEALRGRLPMWKPDRGTPFSLPVFVREPDALIARLREQRIFTSRLWPDAEHDAGRHPAAAWLVRHLVSLPVDQRHSEADMLRVAEAVARAKPTPAPAPPEALRKMVDV